MSIQVDCGPESVGNYPAKACGLVVVDVLRATSTIITALANGASVIWPCATIAQALRYRESEGALLVGERKSRIIAGFDFTNSPADMAATALSGRKLAITTTTGTRLIAAGKEFGSILIASTLNARAVGSRMREIGGDWVVVGAGTRGDFRAEDKVGCAMVIAEYAAAGPSQLAPGIRKFARQYTRDAETWIRQSPSASKLLRIGQEQDIRFVISNVNGFPVVPAVFRDAKGVQQCRLLS
jgi:2-phosphosulfolactate phosphatase